MTDEIDRALQRLAAMPVHPGLAAKEADIMSQIVTDRDRVHNRDLLKYGTIAIVGALVMGIAGGMFESGSATSALSPFAPIALAPSYLLAGIH